MIDRAAYDESEHVLVLTFKESGKYVYYEVPRAVFEALCSAPSPGTFFNTDINKKFACRRDPDRKRFAPAG